jgi:hypothetical protein
MSPSEPDIEYVVEKLAAINGVVKDDLQASDNTVTTYIPTDQLEHTQELTGVNVEILETYEYEYLISAERR